MWIETKFGRLINLSHFREIEVKVKHTILSDTMTQVQSFLYVEDIDNVIDLMICESRVVNTKVSDLSYEREMCHESAHKCKHELFRQLQMKQNAIDTKDLRR